MTQFRTIVLDWYRHHFVEFPWRNSKNPYHSLVGGFCTQQTQMSRAIETHARWLDAFPSMADLAEAETSEVIRVWGKTGYPKRAVHLQRTAQQCIERFGGEIPSDFDDLLTLPGVGPFTAEIVRCFGFGLEVLTTDTNIVRIFGRVFEGDLQPVKDTSKDRIKELSGQFVALGRTDLINPALMDFGASVCTARPKCDRCPALDICRAASKFKSGQVPRPQRRNRAYVGSDREWRGKILELLMHYSRPVSEKKIRKILDLESDEQTHRLLIGLEKDFLISRDKHLVKLG